MRILIIRPGAIGDALLALPIMHALRTRCMDAHITFVSNAAILPLARSSGLADDVSDFQDARWSALFAVHNVGAHFIAPTSPVGASGPVGAINCAPTPAGEGGAKNRASPSYDLAVCWLRDQEGIVERNLYEMGAERVIVARGRPAEGERVHIVDYLAGTINRGLHEEFITPNQRFTLPLPCFAEMGDHEGRRVTIHPGSGGTNKCWPPSSFATVIEQLRERGCAVTLLGGPADHERIAAIRSMIDCSLTMVLDAPLLEAARHIRQSRCYLGNDSGITHLAAMLGVPVVALFGPSDPVIWQPRGPLVEVIHEPRLEDITVDFVVERVLTYA